MVSLLWIIIFPLNGLISEMVTEHFVNITATKCLAISSDDDQQWVHSQIFLRHEVNNSLYIFSSFDIPIDDSLQNVSINRSTKEVKFCIPSTTLNYSGGYFVMSDKTNILASTTLYVMVKPDAPEVDILSNGTFNSEKGVLECKAKSQSLPSGFNITYSWIVNGKNIQEDDKYSFENIFHSKLSFQVGRNEIQNIYSCTGKEEHGQSSVVSSGKSIDPLRSPLSTITPNYPVLKEIKDHPLTLKCNGSDGNPSYYEYSWFKNGIEISEEKTETLYIQHLDHIDGGNYTCSVENSIGNTVSTEVLLDVLYGPLVSTIKSISQEEGKRIILHCNVSSNPLIDVNQVMWSRPNNNTFLRKGTDLEILKVQKEDDGIFQCSANLTLDPTIGDEKPKMELSNVTLNVLYGPSISLISDYHQIEGRTINISCDAISNPPVENKHIEWTKHGSTYKLSGRNLIEKNVTRSFTGKYQCNASVTLNVTVGRPVVKNASKNVSVFILYGPYISLPQAIKQVERRDVNITCDISSYPRVPTDQIIWKKNNHWHSNGSILFIPEIKRKDKGTYICSVELNLIPTDGPSWTKFKSKSVEIDVLYGPETKYISIGPMLEGNSLNLTCNVSANPVPEETDVIWSKKSNSSFMRTGLQIHMAAVDRKDFGQFVCNVTVALVPSDGQTLIKTDFGLVDLNVHYQPNIVNVTPVMVFEGNSTQIKCVVDANPIPNITWTYMENATNVKETNFLTNSLISTSVIEFQSPRCEDTGKYRCLASNNIKTPTNEMVLVNVKCAPRLSYLKSSNITIGRNESLNLTVMFHSVPEPSFTWEFNKSDLSNFVLIPVNDSLPYKFGSRIEKVDFGESNIGQYTISASNELGTASEILTIKYQREPFKPDIDDLICGEVPGTATLDWSSLGNGGLEQHFVIVYRQLGQMDFFQSDKIKENEENKYTRTFGYLIENSKYVFKIKAENDLGSKHSLEVNCTVSGKVDQVPVLPIVGGVTGSALAISALVALFFIRRRRKSKQPRYNKALIQSNAANGQDDDEGLKDNPLYVQSDTVHEYSRKRSNDQGNMKKKNKEVLDDVYENSEDFIGIGGTVYGNVNGNMMPLKNVPVENKKNKDGLVYADLEFNLSSSSFVIHGLENKNVYADIDLTQKAEPLPAGSDDDEKNN